MCCVIVRSLIFQRRNLQDKSVSIHAASLWLQLEFVENGPMAKECGQGREEAGTVLAESEIFVRLAQETTLVVEG